MKVSKGDKVILLQKRLLLYNLKDLYLQWKKESQFEIIPGFILFTELRPKQCLFAGAPETYSVCICPIHQNFKLNLVTLKLQFNYKILIEKSVCSLESYDCMYRKCSKCSSDQSKKKIYTFLNNNCQNSDKITYEQWIIQKTEYDENATNKTILQTISQPYEIFIKDIINDLLTLTTHHFVNEN